MQEYSYIPVNGHAVARIHDRLFLLSPGLPFTIAERPLVIDGRRIEGQEEVLGLTAASLSDRVGVKLDGVLGANLCDQFVVNFDPKSHRVEFDQTSKDYPINLEIDNFAGAARWHLSINGKRAPALLDLGIRLSLVHPELLVGQGPIAQETELFSLIGARKVDVYSLPVMIDREVIHLRFARMPDEVAFRAEMANVQAFIGYELLEHYAISLAMEEGLLALEPLH